MGLAPQVVAEIFEIVRDLNRKERVIVPAPQALALRPFPARPGARRADPVAAPRHVPHE